MIENCPFCGHLADFDAVLFREGIKDHVGCTNTECPAYQFQGIHIDDWNNRPNEDVLRGRLSKTIHWLKYYRDLLKDDAITKAEQSEDIADVINEVK